jgi:hypothetical protein
VSNGTVEREQTNILLDDTVSSETAERISVGDVEAVGNYEVAEVESVTTYGTSNPDQCQVFVGLSLNTLAADERPEDENTTVREGNSVSFQSDGYSLVGTVRRVGALEQRGTPTNETVTLQVSNVAESRTDSFDVGMTEQSGGQTVATVTNVSVEPATVVTTADNGSVNAVDHPYLRDVTLTTKLRVRETPSGILFRGERIQYGSTVLLDLGTVTVKTTVVDIGQ